MRPMAGLRGLQWTPVLLTGGASGIGRAIALRLGTEGALVRMGSPQCGLRAPLVSLAITSRSLDYLLCLWRSRPA